MAAAASGDDSFNPNSDVEEEEWRFHSQHQFDKIYSLHEAHSVEEHTEEMEFQTWCCLASFWQIEIQITKEIPYNNFNMLVTIRRTDMSDFQVHGILCIWFLNIEGKKCPVPYRLECILNGRGVIHNVFSIDEHYRCLLRNDDYFTFPHDVLVVKVELFVRSCCEVKTHPDNVLNDDDPELKSLQRQVIEKYQRLANRM